MRNRVRFFVLLGLGTALLGSACDNGTPCTTASSKIQDTCGAAGFDTLGTTRAGFETACGAFMDTNACQTCVNDLLVDSTACASLRSCADECVCAPGTICTLGDAGPGDAGPVADSGTEDGGIPSNMCQALGQTGGRCRGTFCSDELTCFPELLRDGMGQPFTLRSIFDIPSVMADPANPGQYVPSDVDVPIGFGPGGQCTNGCNPQDSACGDCSSCTGNIGGSPNFGAVGITVRTFDGNDPPLTNDTNTGICRANCAYDPATSGCQDGYSCDVTDNVCLEACTADSQCNLNWDVTRHDGLVAVVDGAQTCNETTGRCDWEPPADAAFGSECESNADCPADIGACVFGHCSTWQCDAMDDAGNALHPCPTDAQCVVGFGANGGGLCIQTCDTPDDCFSGQACSGLLFGAATPTVCYGICNADSQCHADEACQIGGFQDPTIGSCQPRCDPAGTDCDTGELCVQVEGQSYGFCRALDGVCGGDADCWGTQACEMLGNDALGLCVDGCTADGDCDSGEECRIQAGGASCGAAGDCASGVCEGATCGAGGPACASDDDCTGTTTCGGGTCAASTRGVCRAAGGECSMSADRDTDGTADLPLRGDAQCLESQRCNSTTADVIGACVDRPVTPSDAGTGTADAGA